MGREINVLTSMDAIGILIANKPKEESACITITNTVAAAIATATNITTTIATITNTVTAMTTAAAATASIPPWRNWWR